MMRCNIALFLLRRNILLQRNIGHAPNYTAIIRAYEFKRLMNFTSPVSAKKRKLL